MAGKKGLIMGVANERSIAWGIAKACHDHGAEIAFTFQGEALERRVRPLATSIGSTFVEPCDVRSDEQIARVFDAGTTDTGGIALMHAVLPVANVCTKR